MREATGLRAGRALWRFNAQHELIAVVRQLLQYPRVFEVNRASATAAHT
jgi:hypothetical protein